MSSWRLRHHTFEKASISFSELAQMDIENADKIHREAFVKRFELAFESTKSVLKRYLQEQGSTIESLASPKSIMREALRCQCIQDAQVWLDAIDYRNKAAHVYREELLKYTVSFAQKKFWPELQSLRRFFKTKASS